MKIEIDYSWDSFWKGLIILLIFAVGLTIGLSINLSVPSNEKLCLSQGGQITATAKSPVKVMNYGERYVFERIAKNLADERDYDREEYNCVDMSEELQRRLYAEGYRSNFAYGYLMNVSDNGTVVNTIGGHEWVKLEVLLEATTGEVIDVGRYKEYNETGYCSFYNCSRYSE